MHAGGKGKGCVSKSLNSANSLPTLRVHSTIVSSVLPREQKRLRIFFFRGRERGVSHASVSRGSNPCTALYVYACSWGKELKATTAFGCCNNRPKPPPLFFPQMKGKRASLWADDVIWILENKKKGVTSISAFDHNKPCS